MTCSRRYAAHIGRKGEIAMSQAQRKIFKIERQLLNDADMGEENHSSPISSRQLEELMREIGDIKQMLAGNGEARPAGPSPEIMEKFRADMEEASRIRAELEIVQKAINRTKEEIAALSLPGGGNADINRMTHELGAIIEGTEQATETILSSVEQIDENAGDLLASCRGRNQKDLAADIQEQVVKVYEACNFQDLTGQRIFKVIRAFGFIEKRVEQMMEIWGGIDSFREYEQAVPVNDNDASHLLNGPALKHDADTVSQDDIDALFD
jgi:chemotaxis protein CheZ